MFTIADPLRLLDDYMHHRASFEGGRNSALEQTEPVSRQQDDSFEGEWGGVDAEQGRWVRHRVMLARNVLVDFRFEASAADLATFELEADAILGSAELTSL